MTVRLRTDYMNAAGFFTAIPSVAKHRKGGKASLIEVNRGESR